MFRKDEVSLDEPHRGGCRWVQKLERVENMRRSDSHRMIGSNDVCVPQSTFVSRHMPLGLALANLGHEVSPHTVANILKRHGIDPAPGRERKTTWKEFVSRHFDQIAATDFFTVEVWTLKGLQRFMILFFIELSSRRVQLGGVAKCPNGLWMEQVGRNVTDCEDGILKANPVPDPRARSALHSAVPRNSC